MIALANLKDISAIKPLIEYLNDGGLWTRKEARKRLIELAGNDLREYSDWIKWYNKMRMK